MTVVKWAWRGQVHTDYYIFPWLKFSKQGEDVNIWSWTFYWKGSRYWYYNFKRRKGSEEGSFGNTRLTLRFGKHIIAVGRNDIEKMYKNVVLLKMVCRGKVVFDVLDEVEANHEFQYIEIAEDASQEDVREAIEEMKKSYWLLSKDYPSDTWRN